MTVRYHIVPDGSLVSVSSTETYGQALAVAANQSRTARVMTTGELSATLLRSLPYASELPYAE